MTFRFDSLHLLQIKKHPYGVFLFEIDFNRIKQLKPQVLIFAGITIVKDLSRMVRIFEIA